MKHIAKKNFSTNRDDLILQIGWLLNEMSAAIEYIENGEIDKAINVLKEEVEGNVWMSIKSQFKDSERRKNG